jgi:hypothetical protein
VRVSSVDGCCGLHGWENILGHASGVNNSGAGPFGRLEPDGTKTSEQFVDFARGAGSAVALKV